MGSKPIISPCEIDRIRAQKENLGCDGWIAHVSIASDVDVNVIVNGFKTVDGASSIADRVVTEGRPGGVSEFSNIRYNWLQPVTTDPITLGRSDWFQPKSGWLETPFQSSTNRVSTILRVYNYTSLIFCSVQFIL